MQNIISLVVYKKLLAETRLNNWHWEQDTLERADIAGLMYFSVTFKKRWDIITSLY